MSVLSFSNKLCKHFHAFSIQYFEGMHQTVKFLSRFSVALNSSQSYEPGAY